MADISLPQGDLTVNDIDRWSTALLDAAPVAFALSGTAPPGAGANRDSDGCLRLPWAGIWTPGRHAAVVVHPDDAGAVGRVTCLWDAATGRPSKYLNIDELVASMGDCSVYDWGLSV